MVGEQAAAGSAELSADYQIVSPSDFPTLDIPVVDGRAFTDRDVRDTPAVCIVNEATARRLFGTRSPIGRRLSLRPPDAPANRAVACEIVGVARQVKGRPDEADAFLQVYVPLAQQLTDDIYLLVRASSGDAALLTNAVRAAIGRIDSEQLVSLHTIQTLDAIARSATSRHRFRAVAVGAFAGLALVLAMIGVFGLLSSLVQLRAREIAVRRAVGASTSAVLRLVVFSATGVVATGVAIGLLLAVLLGRLLATMLFGVPPIDPLTYGLAAVLLMTTALVSAAAPALRAARIDPAVTLRGE